MCAHLVFAGASMSDADIALIPAKASQKPVITNLIQLYLYDMASQSPFPLDAEGRYEYNLLERFWEHPYLITKNREIAGFCLVINDCPVRKRTPCWFMAEFCVLRPYRRSGVGRYAVSAVFDRHPGEWEISWANDNKHANGFWPIVIPDMKNKQTVSFDGTDWVSVAFTT